MTATEELSDPLTPEQVLGSLLWSGIRSQDEEPMSLAHCRFFVIALMFTCAECAHSSSVPLETSVLSVKVPTFDRFFAKGTCVSLQSLRSPLLPAPERRVQLSLLLPRYPVHILGAWGVPRGANPPAVLLFFERIFLPNRSPCQKDCSKHCEHTHGCPVLQDASRRDD